MPAMRQIVLDTETTGLSAATGDRLIEIGCVELMNRRLTGRHLHFYVNPERDIDEGAIAVHGITVEFLADRAGRFEYYCSLTGHHKCATMRGALIVK